MGGFVARRFLEDIILFEFAAQRQLAPQRRYFFHLIAQLALRFQQPLARLAIFFALVGESPRMCRNGRHLCHNFLLLIYRLDANCCIRMHESPSNADRGLT